MLTLIHIVENLDKGAVENWLVRMFLESRKIHPDWKWTFYCILGKEGRLDETVKAAGGEIIYSPYWISDKYKFLHSLRKTLKAGRYDIIHSHHDYLSGFYLLSSAGISFKKRILHIHNTDKALPVGSGRMHKFLLPVFKRLALYFTDLVVGISQDTLFEFTGEAMPDNKSSCILYYGIDLKPYAPVTAAKDIFYREMRIPAHARILLFVGRMNALKNPVFVVDILAMLCQTRNDVYAVFIGKGDEAAVSERAKFYEIEDRIRLAGWRDDTADIMKMADIFVFPRVEYPKEGLGLVVVEAQAAGMTMVLSNGIVKDAIEINELANVLPLQSGAQAWANEINRLLEHPPLISKVESFQRMLASKFELRRATENLVALYEKGPGNGTPAKASVASI